jgi:hypothetical protein
MPCISGSFVKHGQQFFGNHARVFVVERVVFYGAIGRAVAPFLRRRFGLLSRPARIDEYADHDRDLAPVNQIVEDVLRPYVALRVHKCVPVLKDHQSGGLGRIVLRRDVYPVGALRAGIHLARQRERPADFTLRHAFLRQRVGAEPVLRIGIRTGRHRGRGRPPRRGILRKCNSGQPGKDKTDETHCRYFHQVNL